MLTSATVQMSRATTSLLKGFQTLTQLSKCQSEVSKERKMKSWEFHNVMIVSLSIS